MQFELTAKQKALQPQLNSANINPESFLATDYLNHFNEITMLLEMIPDMPELAEEVADWQPKSYVQHFADSGFQGKDLAIEAYENAPTHIIAAFETVCRQLDQVIKATISAMLSLNVVERGLSPEAQEFVRTKVTSTQDLLLKLNQIIHGKMDTLEIDATEIEEDDVEEVQTQEDIDKLFD